MTGSQIYTLINLREWGTHIKSMYKEPYRSSWKKNVELNINIGFPINVISEASANIMREITETLEKSELRKNELMKKFNGSK